MSIAGNYVFAAWLIFSAGLFDALDGIIARMSGKNSEFGLQLDSLGDVVAAGIAPSILIYEFYFKNFSTSFLFGLIISFLPLLFASYRLARYNVVALHEGKRPDYTGLPAPMAGSTFSSIVILYSLTSWSFLNHFLLVMVPLVSLCMISTLHYDGFPKFSFREKGWNRFKLYIMIISIFCLVFFPEFTLFAFMMFYFVSAPIKYIISTLRNHHLYIENQIEDQEQLLVDNQS